MLKEVEEMREANRNREIDLPSMSSSDEDDEEEENLNDKNDSNDD